MLRLFVKDGEGYDNKTEEFVLIKGQELWLEHSLVSLSKWESFWKKPFLTKDDKTHEESLYYIKCMTITKNVDDSVYSLLTDEDFNKVKEYIGDEMTATTFSKSDNKPLRDVITSEIIYYWMVALNIPFECQKWHLNRLLTLINVCNIKNQPPKKTSRQKLLATNRDLNKARRAKLNTTG